MKKLVILVVLVLLVVPVFIGTGCNQQSRRSVTRNVHYMGDDAFRFAGLDQPSGLHARDNVPWDAYEPYRAME